MQAHPVTRRNFLKQSATLTTPALLAAAASPLIGAEPKSSSKLKVVCIGGHPDDPESGCAGTLARYVELGHSVAVVYLTRGERGIRDTGLDEAAKIRSAESETACQIIGARPRFFGQIDGATEMTRAHVETMTKILSE